MTNCSPGAAGYTMGRTSDNPLCGGLIGSRDLPARTAILLPGCAGSATRCMVRNGRLQVPGAESSPSEVTNQSRASPPTAYNSTQPHHRRFVVPGASPNEKRRKGHRDSKWPL